MTSMSYSRMRLGSFRAALLVVVWSSAFGAKADVERIATHQNRDPAGRFVGQTLRVELEAREGVWYPEVKKGPGIPVQAFGERGKRLSVPGPLIRVPEGTQIRATLRNTLDVKLVLHGFHGRPGDEKDTLEFAPGQQRDIVFDAGAPGTYFYWGSTMAGGPITGRPTYRDAVLSGAFVIDPKGVRADPQERIFMIAMWREFPAHGDPKRYPPAQGQRRTFAVNGLSWPYTERLNYRAGQAVRWRWINAAFESHPMHLHGFYFDVLSLGEDERDVMFAPEQRPHVVTQLMLPGNTMSIEWLPDRIGNWLFHCHMLDHIGPHTRLRPGASPAEDHHAHGSVDHVRDGMSGLVMGVTVRPARRTAVPAIASNHRELKLFIQEEPNRFGDQPALGYALQQGEQEPAANLVNIPGPTLFLTRGEPTAIKITNRTREDTSVHWHGMELESYFDGVPGWGGDTRRTTPPIAPGESFIAEMTPPRAGTFIYHTHWHDEKQLTAGMYGPLIVLEPGQVFDPATERIVLLSTAPYASGSPQPVLLNGSPKPEAMQLQVGKTYRFRLINITANAVIVNVHLFAGSSDYPQWRAIAKDGANLPAAQAVVSKSMQRLTVGETRDFEYQPAIAGDMRLEARGGPNLLVGMDVRVR